MAEMVDRAGGAARVYAFAYGNESERRSEARRLPARVAGAAREPRAGKPPEPVLRPGAHPPQAKVSRRIPQALLAPTQGRRHQARSVRPAAAERRLMQPSADNPRSVAHIPPLELPR